jgi:hypothetical protein
MPPALVPFVPWQIAQEAARSRPVFGYVPWPEAASGMLTSATATISVAFIGLSLLKDWNRDRSFRSAPTRVKWRPVMTS